MIPRHQSCQVRGAVTIVISLRQSTAGKQELHVAGWLAGDAVGALEHAVAEAPGAAVNLAELRGLDEGGESLLRRLRGNGTALTGVSPFMALLLRSDAGSV